MSVFVWVGVWVGAGCVCVYMCAMWVCVCVCGYVCVGEVLKPPLPHFHCYEEVQYLIHNLSK